MKIYLAAIENGSWKATINPLLKSKAFHRNQNNLAFHLISYYYLNETKQLEILLDISDEMLVDSGAHSFQHGKKVDFDEYTRQYVEFVKRHTNNPKIKGFFEMDIDNVVGYNKVLEYRKMLETVSDKIIPVWHRNRGIQDFYEMCEKYKYIAITGFMNNDILDSQYQLFINYAHSKGCKIHILGMTRMELLQKLHLNKNDTVDSSSWRMSGIFGNLHYLQNSKLNITQIFSKDSEKIKGNLLSSINYLTWRRFSNIKYHEND